MFFRRWSSNILSVILTKTCVFYIQSSFFRQGMIYSLFIYSWVANRREGLIFRNFYDPRSLSGTHCLLILKKKNLIRTFLLLTFYFSILLNKNAYLTPLWCIFVWYYSSGLINDSFAIMQSKFSTPQFLHPFIEFSRNFCLPIYQIIKKPIY